MFQKMKAKASAILRKTSKKTMLLGCFAVLLATVAVTFAALRFISGPIKNDFEKPYMDNEIVEQFENNEKESIKVKNTGKVDEFVRVAVVVNFKNATGEVSAKTVSPEYYTFSVNTADWVKKGDYWYHKDVIQPGELSSEFLASGTKVALTAMGLSKVPADYHFSFEILVEAVQTAPSAVADAWGLNAVDDALSFS